MAALAYGDSYGLGTSSDGSPYTTSSDDLFADINWPEDEFESPFSGNECLSAENSDQYENESPKASLPTQMNLVDTLSLTCIRVELTSERKQLPCLFTTVGHSMQMAPPMLRLNLKEGLDSLRKPGAS